MDGKKKRQRRGSELRLCEKPRGSSSALSGEAGQEKGRSCEESKDRKKRRLEEGIGKSEMKERECAAAVPSLVLEQRKN